MKFLKKCINPAHRFHPFVYVGGYESFKPPAESSGKEASNKVQTDLDAKKLKMAEELKAAKEGIEPDLEKMTVEWALNAANSKIDGSLKGWGTWADQLHPDAKLSDNEKSYKQTFKAEIAKLAADAKAEIEKNKGEYEKKRKAVEAVTKAKAEAVTLQPGYENLAKIMPPMSIDFDVSSPEGMHRTEVNFANVAGALKNAQNLEKRLSDLSMLIDQNSGNLPKGMQAEIKTGRDAMQKQVDFLKREIKTVSLLYNESLKGLQKILGEEIDNASKNIDKYRAASGQLQQKRANGEKVSDADLVAAYKKYKDQPGVVKALEEFQKKINSYQPLPGAEGGASEAAAA